MKRVAALLAAALASLTTSNAQQPLQYYLDVAGYQNTVYRDATTAVQLLFNSESNTSPTQRFVAAFPEGNSGAVMYFVDNQRTVNPLSVKLVNGSLTSITEAYNHTGIQGTMSINTNASVGVTIMGGTRAVRDYVEGNGLMHSEFNYTISSYNASYVHLHRAWLNGTYAMDLELYSTNPSALTFDVLPPVNFTSAPQRFDINLSGNSGAQILFKVHFNESSIGSGFSSSDLFLTPSSQNVSATGNTAKLNAITALYNTSLTGVPATQVSFLTYETKFLAGGWRFLTYFGRDDMFALRLLMPILQPAAIEGALSGVLERLYVTGANGQTTGPLSPGEVCHEETIGDYATFVNAGNGQYQLGNLPFYDYKMIDTSYLLLPTLAHYFLDLPQGQGRAAAFFSKNSTLQTTYGRNYNDLLNLNIQHVINTAAPFAANPTAESLIHFKYDEPVGQWRDSNNGNGYGRIPFDVNVALVPACLRAIAQLSQAGIISSPYAANASQYAAAWEANAPSFFKVTASTATLNARLANYTAFANLTADLSYGEGAFDSTQLIGSSNAATTQWLNNAGSNHSFYALSLFNDSTAVETLHSDLGEALLYGNNLSEDLMKAAADALLPFPRGLLTPIGMVVANPALDSNTTNWVNFGRDQYQGTVVWGWQMGIFAAGLARQLNFCNNQSVALPQVDSNVNRFGTPSWCTNSQLLTNLRAGADRLWASIEGAGANKFSEVWSYAFNSTANGPQFSVVDLGAISPSGTESDAIQLWSYGFLALADPRTSA